MAFIGTLDLTAAEFTPTSITNVLDKQIYLSNDDTYEYTPHPLVFSAKARSHLSDSSTYKDIIRSSENGRKLWDVAMIKELKSLRDLGSFKMVKRPSGANVFQSTWAYKKKRYHDGSLKKYKNRFCVQGDQKIEGVYVFETYVPVVLDHCENDVSLILTPSP